VGTAFRQLGLVLACCCAAAIAAAQDRQLLIAPVKPAPAGERRVALVIGNSSYKSSPLRNPVRDARAMAQALAATGFKVTVVEDVRAEILGVSGEGILESNGYSSSVHSMQADLEVVYPIWNFSPYLLSFAELHAEMRWSDIMARNDRYCLRVPTCVYQAKVVGTESVRTPAGAFDALKVEVELTASFSGFYMRRVATYWSGNVQSPDYDLELVSYKLN
jgi:hypothetical protein